MADPTPGSRAVEVPLRRLDRWLAGFAARHGEVVVTTPEPAAGWVVRAADGATARIGRPAWLGHVANGPATGPAAAPATGPATGRATGPATGPAAAPAEQLAALGRLTPEFGVLLIRRAGYAVASFHGSEVVERKVGSRHIHGRTAAGGWSQQRYARRRANQADEIVGAAVAAAVRILGRERDPGRPGPQFLVTGGDRPLVAAVVEGLDPVAGALPVAVHLGVGTPDGSVLAGIPDRVLAVEIEVAEPPHQPEPGTAP